VTAGVQPEERVVCRNSKALYPGRDAEQSGTWYDQAPERGDKECEDASAAAGVAVPGGDIMGFSDATHGLSVTT